MTTEAPGGVKRRKVREGRNGERREAREPPSTATTGFSRRKKVPKEGGIQQAREMSCVMVSRDGKTTDHGGGGRGGKTTDEFVIHSPTLTSSKVSIMFFDSISFLGTSQIA